MDFSKCQCEQAGWCSSFKKEMTNNPPNFQWCKGTSALDREWFFNQDLTTPRILIKSHDERYAPVRYFFDKISPQKHDVAICVIAGNKIAIEQLNITKNNIIKYAKKCNADYIELTGDQFPEYPMFNKYRLFQVTSKYQKTLYLDCDVIIKDDCPNLFKITPDDKISGYDQNEILRINDKIKQTNYYQEMETESKKVRIDFQINNDCYIQPNGGVLIIPQKLSDLYKQPDRPYNKTWCFDQYYLSCFLTDDNFFNLNPIFNWEYIRHDFWQYLDNAYIIHADGSRPHTYRLKLLSNLIEKKYSYLPPPNPELNSGHDGWRPVWFIESNYDSNT